MSLVPAGDSRVPCTSRVERTRAEDVLEVIPPLWNGTLALLQAAPCPNLRLHLQDNEENNLLGRKRWITAWLKQRKEAGGGRLSPGSSTVLAGGRIGVPYIRSTGIPISYSQGQGSAQVHRHSTQEFPWNSHRIHTEFAHSKARLYQKQTKNKGQRWDGSTAAAPGGFQWQQREQGVPGKAPLTPSIPRDGTLKRECKSNLKIEQK